MVDWRVVFERLYSRGLPGYKKAGWSSQASLLARRRLLKRLVPATADSSLDVGCAWGSLADLIPGKYVGIDIVEPALKELREMKRWAVLADAQKLPFKKCIFSLVVCSETIQYIAKAENFIKEVHRTLRKDGIFIISAPNPESIFWLRRSGVSPLKLIYIDELKSMLENAGFKILRRAGITPLEFLLDIPDPVAKFFEHKMLIKSFALICKKL